MGNLTGVDQLAVFDLVGLDPSVMAPMALTALLLALPALPPLRGDIAYLIRKAYPGSGIERLVGRLTGATPRAAARSSVLDVAVLIGIAMALCALSLGPGALGPGFGLGTGLGLTLLLLMTFDLRYRILPDQLTLPLAALGVLAAPINGLEFQESFIGLVGAGASVWLVKAGFLWLRGFDGMGGGDVKLVAAMGAWLGPIDCASAIAAAAIAALAVEIAIKLWRARNLDPRHLDPRRKIPFGAFLCGALWVFWCAGTNIV